MDGQDWTPVVLGNKKAKVMNSGNHREIIEKKALSNSMGASFHKLESTETAGTLKRLSNESKQTIVAKRAAAGWNQARLNQECNFPINTIRDIECGKICPNVQQLNVLNRVLKTGLTYEK